MKRIVLFSVLALFLFATIGCEKDEKKKDNIVFRNISKQINISNKEEIYIGGEYVIFEIMANNNNPTTNIRVDKSEDAVGDAFLQVITRKNTKKYFL